ncbi:MAG: hypothetical protein ACR2PG_15270, partial [Hyphomicrobiaceae bacterium]
MAISTRARTKAWFRLKRAAITAVAGIAVIGLHAAGEPATAQNKFVFANASAYDTLDPHAVFDVGRVAVRLNLYDGLLRWLDNPAKLTNWLAE